MINLSKSTEAGLLRGKKLRVRWLFLLVVVSACQTVGGTSADPESGLLINYPPDASCPKVSSYFRSWTNSRGQTRVAPHDGIDIHVPFGTPVRAIADGTIVRVRPNRQRDGQSYGMAVVVEHQRSIFRPNRDVIDGVVESKYIHVQSNIPVDVGENVKMGQTIAYVGRHPNGNHLHLSVVLTIGGFVNPLYVYLDSFDPFTTDSKSVDIAYTDGTEIFPKDTKRIWPIACKRSG